MEAARAGANVTVLDMGSVFGGHAVMSSGMVCLVRTPEQIANHVADSVELACRDFIRFGEDADADWVRFYAKNSRREVYDWLRDLGFSDWELYPQVIPGNSVRRQHASGRFFLEARYTDQAAALTPRERCTSRQATFPSRARQPCAAFV